MKNSILSKIVLGTILINLELLVFIIVFEISIPFYVGWLTLGLALVNFVLGIILKIRKGSPWISAVAILLLPVIYFILGFMS